MTNTLGSSNIPEAMQEHLGTFLHSYAVHDGLPPVPTTSLTLPETACTAMVLTSQTPPRLVPVVQAATAIGPLNSGDGTYWLAVHINTSTAVGGWTRTAGGANRAGSHYLWHLAASQPAVPANGMLLAKITVLGGIVTAVDDLRLAAAGTVFPGDGVTITGAAIQYLLDTVPVGTHILLPPGRFLLDQPLSIARSLSLEGAGMNQSTLLQTVADQPVLIISAVDVHVTGLTVSHSVLPLAGGDGLVVRGPDGAPVQAVTLTDMASRFNWRGFVLGPVAYAQAAHVWAYSNDSHGFEFIYEGPGAAALQWDIVHAISQLNLGVGFAGFNNGSTSGIGPWLTQSVSFGNNQGGYIFAGSAGHPINDLRLTSVLSSADNQAGIYLDTFGVGHLITTPWVELTGMLGGLAQGATGTLSTASHTGHGLGVTANNPYGVAVMGGFYWNCAWSGVALDGPRSQLVGGVSLGNGAALSPTLAYRAGVHIGADGVLVSGHTFQYIGVGPTLHYIHLSEVAGPILQIEIGHNSYDPQLGAFAWIDASEVVDPIRLFPTMAAGLSVFTNGSAASALALVDATNGVQPVKFLRVLNGHLETLNAAATTVIQGLSDEGTPGWPQRAGQVLMENTANTATVTFTVAEPDANYFVQVTVSAGISGPPASGSLTIAGVTKTTAGFTITATAAPGAGHSVMFNWFVHR